MTQAYVPGQGQAAAPEHPGGLPPVHPSVSEATRLLCAGTYLDERYRDAVLDELYLHEERIAAPSLGHDASRVLAHAHRARLLDLGWAAAIAGLWVVSMLITDGLMLILLVPCLMLALARAVRGTAARPPWYRIGPAFVLRWYGRIVLGLLGIGLVAALFSDDSSDSSDGYGYGYDGYGDPYGSGSDSYLPDPETLFELSSGVGSGPVWGSLACFAAIAGLVALQRAQFARVMKDELSPEGFRDQAGDPAESSQSARLQRLRALVRAEQHAPLAVYRADQPFRGAGLPFEPWSIAIELRPRKSLDPATPPTPVSNADLLRWIDPLLAQLRIPSPHGSPAEAALVRDRLRQLETTEYVFLPVDGLPSRAHAPYRPGDFEFHRAGALEEGGEARRHFLRIRIGGWEEHLVTTLFVRVHTQGGMLMLEIAPHVLLPLRTDFFNADRTAYDHRHRNPLGKAVWAVVRTPGSAGRSLVTLGRAVAFGWRLLTGGHGQAMPDGPGLSVRELGSADEASLFQSMDARRYLKTVEDRVTTGIKQALHQAGYDIGEFEQRVFNVSIGNMNGSAVSFGDHSPVTNQSR